MLGLGTALSVCFSPMARGVSVPVAAPTGFGIAASTAAMIVVTWDELPAGVTPRLQVQAAGGDWSEIVHEATEAAPHESTGLAGNTTYDLRLRAEHGGAHSEWLTLENNLTLPAAPASFGCQASGYQTGYLSWEKLPGCLYTVYLGESVLATNLDDDHLYVSYASDADFYALEAVNGTGVGGRSETPGVYGGPSAPACQDLPTITAISSVLFTINEGTCNGGPAPTLFSWQWLRCDPAGTYLQDIAGEAAQTYHATFRDNNRSLRVRETWINDYGTDSQVSDAMTVSAQQLLPAPTNFAVSDRSPSTLVLSWDSLGEGVTYDVWCADAGTSFGSMLNTYEGLTGTTLEVGSLSAGTAYDLRICAVFEEGELRSTWTVLSAQKTRLDVPVDFAFLSATADTISLIWSALPAGVQGAIEWQTHGGAWDEASGAVASGTSHVISGLELGGAYDVRLRAEKAGFEPSEWVTLEPVYTLPAAPANLECVPGGYNSGVLHWDAVAGCTYSVYQNGVYLNSGFSEGYYGVSVSSYPDTYSVYATNPAGDGEASETPGSYGSGTAPWFASPPTITVDEEGLYTAHEGSYEGDPGPDHDTWQWRLCDENGNTVEEIAEATTATYQPIPAQYGYTLRVRETCVSYLGGASADSAATPRLAAPVHAPTTLAVSETTATTLTLTWDAQEVTTTYRVQWAGSAGTFDSPAGEQGGIEDATVTISSLTDNTSYQVRVRAESEGMHSSWAVLGDLLTLPAAPGNLVATATNFQNGHLTWDAVPGLTYNVYRFADLFASGLTSGYCDEGFNSDTDSYEVAAVNAAGEGARSGVACAYGLGNAPSFMVVPSISGDDSGLFTAAPGSYDGDPSPEHAGWQWLQCDEAGGMAQEISGETSDTYQATFLLDGCTIRVREICTNAAGSASGDSDATGVLSLPVATPENFVVSSRTSTTLSVTWDSLGGVLTYDVQWITSDGDFASPLDVRSGIGGTSLNVEELTPETSYSLRLRAGGGGTYSDWVTLENETTLPARPDAPTGLSMAPTGYHNGELTWTAGPDYTYNVYRNSELYASGLGNGFCPAYYASDTDVYEVTAVFGGVESDPAGITASYGSGAAPSFAASPTITWDDSGLYTAHEGGYMGDPSPSHSAWQWLLCDESGNILEEPDGATADTYQALASQNGQTLRVRETCASELGSAYQNSEATDAISLTILEAPGSLAVSDRSSSSLTLTWTGPADTFHLQWVLSGESFDSPAGDMNGIAYLTATMEALSSYTLYDMRVRTEDSSGHFSDWVMLYGERTLLGQAENFTLATCTTDTLTFTWDALPTGVTLGIQWKASGALWDSPLGDTTTPYGTFDVTGLDIGTAYDIRYRAQISDVEVTDWTVVPNCYTVPPAPTGVTAMSADGGVSVGADARPAGCVLAITRGSSIEMSDATLIANDVEADGYMDGSAEIGVEHFYFLQNKNPAGYSAPSAVVSAVAWAAARIVTAPVIESLSGLPAPLGAQIMVVDSGTWSGYPGPMYDHYQWQRLDPYSMYQDIPGANDLFYEVTAEDLGTIVCCNVYFTNDFGTSSCQSNAIATEAGGGDGGGDGGGEEGGGDGGEEGGGEGEGGGDGTGEEGGGDGGTGEGEGEP